MTAWYGIVWVCISVCMVLLYATFHIELANGFVARVIDNGLQLFELVTSGTRGRRLLVQQNGQCFHCIRGTLTLDLRQRYHNARIPLHTHNGEVHE